VWCQELCEAKPYQLFALKPQAENLCPPTLGLPMTLPGVLVSHPPQRCTGSEAVPGRRTTRVHLVTKPLHCHCPLFPISWLHLLYMNINMSVAFIRFPRKLTLLFPPFRVIALIIAFCCPNLLTCLSNDPPFLHLVSRDSISSADVMKLPCYSS
jgi:hypothetical protein